MTHPCDPWKCSHYNPCRGAATAPCPTYAAWRRRQLVADTTHPCETCLRWSECNGVAWGSEDCPKSKDQKPNEKDVPAYLDDHTLSGLLEERT